MRCGVAGMGSESRATRWSKRCSRAFHDRGSKRVCGASQGFRLGLCRATQAVIARSLDLIGVEAPERM